MKVRAAHITLGLKLGPKILGLITKFAFGGLSILSYAYLFTWQFAFVIVATLIIHEYGHLRAMQAYGMKTKGIFLIPFVGGAAVASDKFPTRSAEANIAFAGPLVGLAQALVCVLVYQLTGDPFWGAVASWCALLNLLNLLPINPLDGGRIVKSMAFSVGSKFGAIVVITGLVLGAVIMAVMGIWLMALIVVVGALDLAGELTTRKPVGVVGGGHAVQMSDGSWEELTIKDGSLHWRRIDIMLPMNWLEIVGMFLWYFLLIGTLASVMYAVDTPESRLALDILEDRHTVACHYMESPQALLEKGCIKNEQTEG